METSTSIGTFTYTTTDASTTGTWTVSTGTGVWTPWSTTQNFQYTEQFHGDDYIKVDKGSPNKARYAVFYAVDKDPVIFCKTRRDMVKAVKGLLKRKEVDKRSIRIFALMGGAKLARKLQ